MRRHIVWAHSDEWEYADAAALNNLEIALRLTAEGEADERGWIITNVKGDRFRCWDDLGPQWTGDPEKATRYARRVDAEAVHAGDDDAWRVITIAGAPKVPARA